MHKSTLFQNLWLSEKLSEEEKPKTNISEFALPIFSLIEFFSGKIFRGFENENGVQDVRDFNSSLMGDKLIVSCSVYEKSETPCQLYPFYYSYG